MPVNWKQDKAWSDKFLQDIKRILGEYLISESFTEEDRDHNTDLIVLKLDVVRIACRIRRYEYVERYPDQFTIRSNRPNGSKTELAKITEGWGDYIFYGFSNEDESGLSAWLLGDLKIFRLWFASQLIKRQGQIPGTKLGNHDGSSEFRAFDINDLPSNFILCRKCITDSIPDEEEIFY